MWTVIGAIAGVLGTIPLFWWGRDLFGADVVVDHISNDAVVLVNRSEHANARNVRLTIAGRGDTDFQLGDDPDNIDYSAVRLTGRHGNIPPQGKVRIGLDECRPNFDYLPAQIEIKTVWTDHLSWLPNPIYSSFNKRRFRRDKTF